jgi:hypothetical protein
MPSETRSQRQRRAAPVGFAWAARGEECFDHVRAPLLTRAVGCVACRGWHGRNDVGSFGTAGRVATALMSRKSTQRVSFLSEELTA